MKKSYPTYVPSHTIEIWDYIFYKLINLLN